MPAEIWGNNAAVRDNFLSKIANRIQTERHARVRLDHTSADERVADFLMELSARFRDLGRDPESLHLSMSRYDIGSYVGLAAETISRTLRRFDDAGLLTVRGKSVALRAPERLQDIAHGKALD